MNDVVVNSEWVNFLKNPQALWILIKTIRYERSNKGILMHPESGLLFEDKPNGFYCTGDFVCKHDYVREEWKKLNPIQRLRAEAGKIDFVLTSDRIVVRAIDMVAFTKTKLKLLNDTRESQSVFNFYKEMPLQGIVVAVGPGFFTDSGNRRPLEVEVGDHIALEMGTHVSDFVFDEVLYYHCRANSVLGKFGPEVAENYRKFELSFVNPNIKS